MSMTAFRILLLLALSLHVAFGASLTAPSSVYAPGAGVSVGWSFTLENDTGYLVVETSDFCTGALATPCTNMGGIYTDFIGANFVIVGPVPESPVVSQTFDFGAMTGLGALEVTAPYGQYPGTLFVMYSLYSRSPNDPDFTFADLISTGHILEASTKLVVGVTPEPGTGVLLLLALPGLALLRQKRRR